MEAQVEVALEVVVQAEVALEVKLAEAALEVKLAEAALEVDLAEAALEVVVLEADQVVLLQALAHQEVVDKFNSKTLL
ncbi:MAG: hypothetical protein ACI9N1_001883 [Flavobacteriales bacterium]